MCKCDCRTSTAIEKISLYVMLAKGGEVDIVNGYQTREKKTVSGIPLSVDISSTVQFLVDFSGG